jgi:hypothetical protein
MEEDFLFALRQTPNPAFAERLRGQLRQQPPPAGRVRHWPVRRLLVAASVTGLAIASFTIPAVRASAESFLSMFRVVNFVAVSVDPSRLDALAAQQLDIRQLIGEHVQVIEDPGQPLPMTSLDQMSATAGFELRQPQWLPADTRIVEMAVSGEGAARVTADAHRLQQMMDALGITDLTVPANVDGQVMTVRVPPIAMIRYEHGRRHSRLFQSRPPEVTMPTGIDLSVLGEIGLRILGLSAGDAHQFARSIDWQTTLVVPLPPNARSIKQIDINGHSGIAIDYQPPNEAYTRMILWSTGNRVFVLVSVQSAEDTMAMATSIP